MIKSLSINNYALIKNLEMSPSPHLNIITGETGAGKSIMLGAVGLLVGNRADTKTLFTDKEKCIVEGIFSIGSYHLESFFEANELDYDEECIIRREISAAGKSRGFINDTPVTLDVLKSLGESLLDVHSQHETLKLGNNHYQQNILDLYAGNSKLLSDYQAAYSDFVKQQSHFETLKATAQQSSADLDYKQFLYNELEEANLQAEEQDGLENELRVLEHAEDIKTNLAQLTHLLDESEFAVNNQLTEGLSLLSSLKDYSEALQSYFERMNSVNIELKDLAAELSREQENVEFDPERIQLVKDRLDLIFRLQQKHQVAAIGELITIHQQLDEELSNHAGMDKQLQDAEKKLKELEKEVLSKGQKLTAARTSNAKPLSSDIEKIIHKLGIENGQVEIKISTTTANQNGLDKVDILFTANKGVAPQELKQVASGGEFSRLIFAVKYLLADKTALPTLIFDEIDTGVSGEVALQMIEMMKQMSKRHQVISISHLPQFAAGGDAHYFVYKDHSEEKSVSRIKKLEDEERVLEIAKMIGGNNPGEHAMTSARELLNISA
ncbi:MAG: DNA repair protein RecN [Cyclobacteriaceae bacterium]